MRNTQEYTEVSNPTAALLQAVQALMSAAFVALYSLESYTYIDILTDASEK